MSEEIDNLIKEFIKNKSKEIGSRVALGKNLTQDDMNTLAIREQLKHLEHTKETNHKILEEVKNLKVETIRENKKLRFRFFYYFVIIMLFLTFLLALLLRVLKKNSF